MSLTAQGLPGWKVTLGRIGKEQQPILIIDNFSPDPRIWFEKASALSFTIRAPYYPGIRAKVAEEYLADHIPPLTPLLKDLFGFKNGIRVTESNYSLVTTRPENLLPPQVIPHFDGGGDNMVALLHYLCAPAHGGTAFYRHRSTGLETILDKDYEPIYRPALLSDAERCGMPPQRYFRESDDIFERIYSCDAVFNRAIVYRGSHLHAIDIPDGFAFDPSPSRGRLTVNTFMIPK